jgi:hypothetical protein
VSNGGVSKASKTLHVSEDIFGGINVVLRGGAVEYYEFIHCGKGRDITFGGVNGFEQKIAGGNAYQAVSRDLSRLARAADLPRVFSLFSTGVGHYVGTALLSWALHLFLVCQLLLAATDRASFFENSDIPFDMDVPGNTGTYDSGYILQLGFIMMLPLFVARWAEEGFATALAEFVSQTFAGKPLFGLFSMRTNMHYLDLGLRLGQASYIATGRTYTTMISNFTTLYSMYARSHFYFAAELLLLTGGWAVLARNPPGMEVWPGVLYAGSLLLSPWLFSPASFRFLSIRESYVEFIMWLDDRPGIPLTVGKGSYKDWHEALIKPQRGRSGRHAILMLLSRHVPVRVVVYLCCASALVVDAFPNSRPAHRALILAEASALFLTFGVLYYFVVDHRLLRRGILPQSIWAHFAFCWTVRVGTFILYYLAIQFLYATGDGATNPRGGNELGPAGDTPKNLFLLFIAGLTVQSFIAHALARLSPPKKNKKAYVTDALLRYA